MSIEKTRDEQMSDALERIEEAIQNFIALYDDGEANGMLTSYVVAYEALDMSNQDHQCYTRNYVTGGPSTTPSSSLGLAQALKTMLKQDILPTE